MNPYVSITFRTVTIWIMSAVINGVLCGIYLGIIGYQNESVGSWMFLVLICSLFFSVPGFLVFWIKMLFMINRNKYGRSLFRSALSTCMILSCLTAFFSKELFKDAGIIAISSFIILSPMLSIMMHFNLFKKIGNLHNQKGISIKLQNQNLTAQ